jgi:hypothetical protein
MSPITVARGVRIEALVHQRPEPGDDGGPEGRHVQVDRDRGQAWLHEAQAPLREQQGRASGDRDRHHLRGRAPREGGGEAEHGQPRNHRRRDHHEGQGRDVERRQEERVACGSPRDLLRDERARRQHGRHDRAAVAGCARGFHLR